MSQPLIDAAIKQKCFTYNNLKERENDAILWKRYQILSEDARCDLSFLLENVSKYDHVAARAYFTLVKYLQLTVMKQENADCLNIVLGHKSVWDHAIPIAAACKHFNIKLQALVDTNQCLNITQFFTLYCIQKLNGNIYSTPQANSISEITEEQLKISLQIYIEDLINAMNQTFANHELKPTYVVVSSETSVFSKGDFTTELDRQVTESQQSYSIIPVVETESDAIYIYQSWIQTMNEDCNFRFFFKEIDRDISGKITAESLSRYFDKLSDVAFDGFKELQNYDAMLVEICSRWNSIYNTPKKYDNPRLVKVARPKNLASFKTFLDATHSVATGTFLSPLSAVMNYRFMYKSTDSVVCFITGAILTGRRQQNFASYLYNQLSQSLRLTNDVINLFIGFDTSRMSNTLAVLEIFEQLKISIANADYVRGGVKYKLKTPGYDELIAAKELLEIRIPGAIVEFDYVGDIHPNIPKEVCYSNEHSDPQEYISNIKSFDDITPESIKKAYEGLRDVRATDESIIFRDKNYSNELGLDIVLQMENMQQTGSFKIRGASNMLIKAYNDAKAKGENIKGVVACSAGNHAQGVAKTAQLLNIRCTIVCPETAPHTKLYNTLRYNAEVIKHGKVFDEANNFAIELARKRGWVFVPPYNHFDIIEGQGTIAHELLTKYPDLEYILVNVGGGGMISGIALYAKKVNPKIKIIGVQAQRVFPLDGYNNTGTLVAVDPRAGTIADGCNVKHPGGIHNEILHKWVDQYVCVDENEIAATIVNMLNKTKTLTEGAGCMGLAALLYGKLQVPTGSKVAIVICGGNIDCSRLLGIYRLGQIAMGKLIKAHIVIRDTAGNLNSIFEIIAQHGAVCDYVTHTRNESQVDWDVVHVTLEIRVADRKAGEELKKTLRQLYTQVEFPFESLEPLRQ